MKAKSGLSFVAAAICLLLSHSAFAGSCYTSWGNCNYFSAWGYGSSCNNNAYNYNNCWGYSSSCGSGSSSTPTNTVPAIQPAVQITSPAGLVQLDSVPSSITVTVNYTTPKANGSTITLFENGILVGTYNIPVANTNGTTSFSVSLAGVSPTDIVGFQAVLTPGVAASSSGNNSSGGSSCNGYSWNSWYTWCWSGSSSCDSGNHYDGDDCYHGKHKCKTARYGGCYNNNNCGWWDDDDDSYHCGSTGGSTTPVAGPVTSDAVGIFFSILSGK